jgi:hypothetical protein
VTAGAPPPEGAPLVVEWDGILEGRVASMPALQAAAAAMSACGSVTFACEITGGRFSLLPRETSAPGAKFDGAAQARFLAALEGFLAAAQPDSIESTLRSKMIYAEQVAETLFAMRGEALEPVTRVRPRLPGEGAAPLAGAGNQRPLVGRREILLLVPLLLLLGGYFVWSTGLFDRVLAARAEQLALETGPFGKTLTMAVERSLGMYEVTLRRGPDYPKDAAALAGLRDAASSLVDRAACDVVGSGGKAWVQVVNAGGAVRATAAFELRDLLTQEDGKVKAIVPGAMDATTIRLSLTREAAAGR